MIFQKEFLDALEVISAGDVVLMSQLMSQLKLCHKIFMHLWTKSMTCHF